MKQVKMKTKNALPIPGFLRATWIFTVYFKNRKERQTIHSGDSSSNVLRSQNNMFRQAFKDAKFQIFYLYGSRSYTAKLYDYNFFYFREEYKGTKAERNTKEYYASQVPETERNYTRYYEREIAPKRRKQNAKQKTGTTTKNKQPTKKNKKTKQYNTKQRKLQRENRNRNKNKRIKTFEKARQIVK